MSKTTHDWSSVPLFRAATHVLSTPVHNSLESDCWGPTPRLNVGNIHAIKQYWQRQAEGAENRPVS
ncbi:hypothetical protein [Pseudomonas purpurea]|uniref:hypothetical protein n=1 Tax=Pseudomonas purpurea TaxID=3136737 RepID=UPI003263C233